MERREGMHGGKTKAEEWRKKECVRWRYEGGRRRRWEERREGELWGEVEKDGGAGGGRKSGMECWEERGNKGGKQGEGMSRRKGRENGRKYSKERGNKGEKQERE